MRGDGGAGLCYLQRDVFRRVAPEEVDVGVLCADLPPDRTVGAAVGMGRGMTSAFSTRKCRPVKVTGDSSVQTRFMIVTVSSIISYRSSWEWKSLSAAISA